MTSHDEKTTDRKQQIIDAAAALFAENSYYKTTTAHIANQVGVTQPYVFHFFKSKEELYLAVLEQAYQQISQAFTTVEAAPEMLVEAMGTAFVQLLAEHRHEILLVMTSFAIPEPAIRQYAQTKFELIYERIKSRFEQAGFPDAAERASAFVGQGMTITLAEILNLPTILPWCDDQAPQI